MKKDVVIILSAITVILLVGGFLFKSEGLFLSFGAMCIVLITYIITTPKNTTVKIKLVIDYSKTIEQVIADSNYDYKDYNITNENFPISPEMAGKKVKVKIKLFHFNCDTNSERALADMDDEDYRPADLMELLVLDAAYPELASKFPVIALGSFWSEAACSNFSPCVSLRRLYLSLSRDTKNRDCRFLGVKK